MKIRAIKTGIFRENDDLIEFILKYVKKIPEKSILVVTSKIVALSEGRVVKHIHEKQKIALIKKESNLAIKTKHTWLTIKDGMVMASAGVDESNGNGKLILLPKDSFVSAAKIRSLIKNYFKIKKLGVIISDSALIPRRAGVVGAALGYAGFQGIKNYIRERDIFNRVMKISRTNVADSLATAATLCMGEGGEKQPLALIVDAPVRFTDKINKKELKIKPNEDIYAPLFNKLN